MGRSLTPIKSALKGLAFDTAAGLPFESQGVRYTVEHRGGRLFHKAERPGPDGRVLSHVEAQVRYALGSGTRGIVFLIERDGFLFQSPIAWFAQERRWDISPGYGEFSKDPDFERPIQPDCLFCHTNQFRPVAGMLNRYETPIFQGHAVGCERCHGPGELHVSQGELTAGSDLTIVNPAKLTPALRESVCQQCHVQGRYRFTRAGREPLEFRPGLPLHRFWAVFLTKQRTQGHFEAVGHVEQMESSRCFRASRGQLGCISCHDPHRLPPPATKAAYYRQRCLTCHEQRGCAAPVAQRQAQGRGDNCVLCHMPRPPLANIPHTAATDHRIKRRPESGPEGSQVAVGQPDEVPLVDYHWELLTEEERGNSARDLGVAVSWAGRILSGSPQVARVAAKQALPLLEAAVRDQPKDLSACESLGHTLEILGRDEEALRAYQGVLHIQPGRELTLRSTGMLLARLKRPDLARRALQEATALDPWRSRYHLALAQVHGQAGDWESAIAACREALRLNPELLAARSLLVQCYLRAREPAQADAELEVLLRFYPASREAWQEWYKREKRTGAAGLDSPSRDEP
jgi:Tfp pilus assembly protein PilF